MADTHTFSLSSVFFPITTALGGKLSRDSSSFSPFKEEETEVKRVQVPHSDSPSRKR